MSSPSIWISLFMAGVALVGLLIHVVSYAHRDGKKEQRLLTVETKVAKSEQNETALAVMASEVRHLGEKMAEAQAATGKQFDELKHAIERALPRRRAASDQ
jgi:biopolymer transport protein ExbB/TolQ